MDKTQLPTFVSPMGKGSVDETHPAFGGVYVGDVSREDVTKKIEAAELILFVGGLMSDFNSGGFTYRVERKKTVEFHSDHMKVRIPPVARYKSPLERELLTVITDQILHLSPDQHEWRSSPVTLKTRLLQDPFHPPSRDQ